MTYSRKTQRLRQLMTQYGVDIREVAQMLGRSYQSVRTWRSVNEQDIPDHLLELLEMKLARDKPQEGMAQ